MIRESFSLEHIEQGIALLGANPELCEVVQVMPTPRGSAAVVSTPQGNILLKCADLDNPDTEQGIDPPRSYGLANEALYLERLSGKAAPELVHYSNKDGLVFLATSFVAGETLDKARDMHSVQSRFVVRQLVSAVAELHDSDVVHGDILPANAIMEPTGTIIMVDFELAHDRREHGSHPGKAQYLSPEAAKLVLDGRLPELDDREETYALTVTCLELLTGRYPVHEQDITLATARANALQYIAEGGHYSSEGAEVSDQPLADRLVDVLHSPPGSRPATPAELQTLTEIHYERTDKIA